MLVGGLVAFGVHKMSQKDADRIEQHTGIPPEELEDADLEQAMDELGIPKQQVTDADQEVGGETASTPSAQGGESVAEQLKSLAELHSQGILTDEEFSNMKKKILDQ